MIDPANLASSTGAQLSDKSKSSIKSLADDYDSFLKLLTAQISNQDPLKPVDSTTFVSQLAQMTQVEQAIVSNTNLEAINSRLAAVGAMSDVQLIGRDVQVASDRITLEGGTASYAYDLPEEAARVEAVITGKDGTEIRKLRDLPTGSDRTQHIVWDGNDSAGLPVPDDTFKIELQAYDAKDNPLSAIGLTRARVERLDMSGDGSKLVLSTGETVSSDTVREVY